MNNRLFLLLLTLSAIASTANVIPVSRSGFPSTSTSFDFSSLSVGTDLNDVAISGVSFGYSVGGFPERDVVQIEGGPGATNDVASPSAVSTGDNTGTVIANLGGPTTFFGYGYALLTFNDVPTSTTISIFSGPVFLNSLVYSAIPDPTFAGGFAGIESSIPFDSVQFTFNSVAAPAFAFNNLILAGNSAAVPEPCTVSFAFAGALLCLGRAFLRRQRTNSASMLSIT